MVVCVLVEGDDLLGVCVAEDIATAATVVSAVEVGEVACAGCFVADLGFDVTLLMDYLLVKVELGNKHSIKC